MINTYRSDLARSLPRDELLELRFDPTISREMVRRLAQEGEAYLRARGHDITAGRLYLCHFLGMDGAAAVLSAGDGNDLAPVVGASVMSANPFLNGMKVYDIKNWAERKMARGKGVRAAPSEPAVETRNVAKTSPEFIAYKAAMTALIAAATADVASPAAEVISPAAQISSPAAEVINPAAQVVSPAGDATDPAE